MDIQEIEWDVDWIYLAQYKYKWRTVLTAVMNLLVQDAGGETRGEETAGETKA